MADFFDSQARPWHGMVFDVEPCADKVAVVTAERVPRLPTWVYAFGAFPVAGICDKSIGWRGGDATTVWVDLDVSHVDRIAIAAQRVRTAAEEFPDDGDDAQRMGEMYLMPVTVLPFAGIIAQAFTNGGDGMLPGGVEDIIPGPAVTKPAVIAVSECLED